MGNIGVHQETSNSIAHNQSAEEASRIAKELAATNGLALDCAVHQRDVPTEGTPKDVAKNTNGVAAADKANPQGEDLLIPLEKVSEVISKAFRIQGEMDRISDAKKKAGGLEALKKEVVEQESPKLSFQELAQKVQTIGISSDALAKAIELSPTEQRAKSHKELALSLGLPEHASSESLRLENELRDKVEDMKRCLSRAIKRLQNPLDKDVITLDSFSILNEPDTSLVFERARWLEVVTAAYHISNPLGWIEACLLLLFFNEPVFPKCFTLDAPLSPALKELQSAADELGGVIIFKIPRGQGPNRLTGGLGDQGQVEILLKLKEPA